jgi:hypothetical protein
LGAFWVSLGRVDTQKLTRPLSGLLRASYVTRQIKSSTMSMKSTGSISGSENNINKINNNKRALPDILKGMGAHGALRE